MTIREPPIQMTFKPIGIVRHQATDVPRHWAVSDLEGFLEIRPEYEAGLTDIAAGQRIMVVFHFHQSALFAPEFLRQKTRISRQIKGVFSICSPRRPNPIGISVLEVRALDGCRIRVRGLDMLDGTPILDIKPPFMVAKKKEGGNHNES